MCSKWIRSERQRRITLCWSIDNVQFFLVLPAYSNLSKIRSIPIIAPPNKQETTTSFHMYRFHCSAQRDCKELLLHDGVPWLLRGQCSAQTLDTSILMPFVRKWKRINTKTATTAPRIIIIVVAGILLFDFSHPAEGGGSVDVTVVVISGAGLCSSCPYGVESLIIS